MTTVISVNQAEHPEHPEDSMLRPEPAVVTRTNSNRSANETKESIVKGKKLGHRRVKDGEVTYKKFETTQLMGSIQLGIQQSVGNLGCQEDRDLLHEDFYTVETVIFSRDWTLQKTPAHNYSQFKVCLLVYKENFVTFAILVSNLCALGVQSFSQHLWYRARQVPGVPVCRADD